MYNSEITTICSDKKFGLKSFFTWSHACVKILTIKRYGRALSGRAMDGWEPLVRPGVSAIECQNTSA